MQRRLQRLQEIRELHGSKCFLLLFLVFLPVNPWRDTNQFFECLCKVVLRRESTGFCNLCDGVVGVTQQSFAVGDPQLQQVVDG